MIKSDFKLLSATIFSSTIYLILLVANCMLAVDLRDLFTNVLIAVLGCAIGWILGTVASPYTNKESTRFGAFGKAVGAFLTGYIFGKMDKLIEHVLTPEFLFKPENGFVIATTLAGGVTTFIVTYVFRNYAPNTRIPGNFTDDNPD